MRSSSLVSAALLALLPLAACAGQTSPPPVATDPDAGVGPTSAGCPTSDPGQGTPCSKEGLLCEIGTDWNPRCNVLRVCSGGRWATPIVPGGGGAASCPSARPTLPPNAPDCAASPSAFPQGSCSSSSTCTYDGAICSCTAFCPSYPIAPPDCAPDAGPNPPNCCDRSKKAWHCFTGPAYCSAPRPRVGAPCTKEGASCAIDAPVECGQTVLQCQGGVWSLPVGGCPLSTRSAKTDLHYLDAAETKRLADELERVRLASYRYKSGDPARHLGFVIEDMPEGSPAVLASRDRVDLYGYVSMTVAALQEQQRQIDALKAEVAECKGKAKR
jgi:hypothetical protein